MDVVRTGARTRVRTRARTRIRTRARITHGPEVDGERPNERPHLLFFAGRQQKRIYFRQG